MRQNHEIYTLLIQWSRRTVARDVVGIGNHTTEATISSDHSIGVECCCHWADQLSWVELSRVGRCDHSKSSTQLNWTKKSPVCCQLWWSEHAQNFTTDRKLCIFVQLSWATDSSKLSQTGRGCGVWMKKHQKEVVLQEGRKNIPEVPRDSYSQSRRNQRSQITSTQRITSSTVTWRLSSAVSLTRQHGGSGRSSRSDRKVKTSWIQTRAPTSWDTSMTTYGSM